MKKLVRLLSVVMLVAMVMSFMTTGALAFVNEGDSGEVVITADQRPSDTSRPDEPDNPNGSTASTARNSDKAAAGNKADKNYSGKGDYSDLENSDLQLVKDNIDFLKYVRDNAGTIDKDTLQTAVDIFGPEIVFGNTAASSDDTLPGYEGLYAGMNDKDLVEKAIKMRALNDKVGTGEAANVLSEEELSEYEALVQESAGWPANYLRYALRQEALDEQIGGGASVQSVVGFAETDFEFVTTDGKYKTFAKAISGYRRTIVFDVPFDICNSTDYRININLNQCTIVAPDSDSAFVISGDPSTGDYGTIAFTNGTINGEGFDVKGGGILYLGGLWNGGRFDITVNSLEEYNAIENCVTVEEGGTAILGEGCTLNCDCDAAVTNNGVAYIEGANINEYYGDSATDSPAVLTSGGTTYIKDNSVIVSTKDSAAVYIEESGEVYMDSSADITGNTGVAVDEGCTFVMNGGSILAKGDATPTGTAFEWATCGSAILAAGDAQVSVFGGKLASQHNPAIVHVESAGGDRTYAAADVENIALADSGIIIQETANKEKTVDPISDYTAAVCTLDGVGYPTVEAAVADAADDGEIHVIKLLTDIKVPVVIDAADKQIVFDGNGHKIAVQADEDAITVSDGDVTIKNVTLRGGQNASAIVTDGGNVTIDNGTYAKDGKYGLNNTGATVTVNDLMIDEDVDIGIYSKAECVTVNMCKDDADTPVDGGDDPTFLVINNGWFLNKLKEAEPDETKYMIATYVDATKSHVEYIQADGYYEVLLNTTPVVQVLVGDKGTNNGKAYIIYDKEDPEMFQLSVTPGVSKIELVSQDGSIDQVIFSNDKLHGYEGLFPVNANEANDLSAILKKLPAGAYDVRFTFKDTNYVLKDKLTLYIFPAVAKLMNEKMTKDVEEYNIGSMLNLAVVYSEEPARIGYSSSPDGSDMKYFDKYIKGNPLSSVPVDSGKYKGNYVYYISAAELNNFSTGQYYIFLEYNNQDGAVERLPLKINNPSVSISPTYVDWSKIDKYANFTVKPDCQEVYIDGTPIDHAYWEYNNKNNTLSIKASYLETLSPGDHRLDVNTSLGKLVATVHTGAALKPKDVDYHVYGGTRSLSFVASDKINYDAGIWIGDVKVDDYIVKDSDRAFTLSANYLNKLPLGTYKVSAYVLTTDNSGSQVYQKCSTTFRVISASQAAYNPSTGDNSHIWLWVVVMALAAVVIFVIVRPILQKKSVVEAEAVAESLNETEKAVEEDTTKKE